MYRNYNSGRFASSFCLLPISSPNSGSFCQLVTSCNCDRAHAATSDGVKIISFSVHSREAAAALWSCWTRDDGLSARDRMPWRLNSRRALLTATAPPAPRPYPARTLPSGPTSHLPSGRFTPAQFFFWKFSDNHAVTSSTASRLIKRIFQSYNDFEYMVKYITLILIRKYRLCTQFNLM